jgi:hypothetical protein
VCNCLIQFLLTMVLSIEERVCIGAQRLSGRCVYLQLEAQGGMSTENKLRQCVLKISFLGGRTREFTLQRHNRLML